MLAGAELGLQIPEEWQSLSSVDESGVLLVIGAPDVGKSTFARYLFGKIATIAPVAFVDGDPGQSSLGPPTTLTLLVKAAMGEDIPSSERMWRRFVGSVSPRGHMLPTVVGAGRLKQKALEGGASAVIYDTCSLVDSRQGGLVLKAALIDLLQPRRVYAIQRETELEPLLTYLRHSGATEVVTLAPAPAAISRSPAVRQEHRARMFSAYFKNAPVQWLDWRRYGIFPAPRFSLNRLMALEDEEGFALALGIILEIDRSRRRIALLAPRIDLEKLRVLHLGDVILDRSTWRDELIGQ
jgi:polynucleotide 5'-hydroxyl-kinase GRC3/NOL9